MIYQYDLALPLPTKDLYDTLVMLMAVAAAKDMYDRGEKRIDEFYNKYGEFNSPISADQDWWTLNVIDPVKNGIDLLYAQGIDPLRSVQGRGMIAQLLRSMPYGTMNKLKQSAENAKLFLRARAELEAKGLYNPLMALYDGPDLSLYSTATSGIWDKMSPTPFQNVATFGNPYFEGMKPNVRRESRNGIDYSVESITEQDLKNVADAHFNELVNTPQGQLMFKYYRDLAGGDNNPQANLQAKEMFNQAIADGQRRRIYTKDDYDDQWLKRDQLKQGWAKINQDAAELLLERDQFDWEKDYYERQLSESGNADVDIPTAGAADQVAINQNKLYNQVKDDYYKQLDNREALAYKKLSTGEKMLADRYKQAVKDDRDYSKRFVQKQKQQGSKNLQDWMNAYDEASNKAAAWENYSSSVEDSKNWGKTQSESALLRKSHESFLRLNIVSGKNAIDTGMLIDINHSLSLIEDGDNQVGVINNGTDFSPIIEAEMTGNRKFRYNSKVNRINRVIQGKPYRITLTDLSGRKYGHGTIKKADYVVVLQMATFTDPSVIAELDKYTDLELNEMGVIKIVENDKTQAYKIPITSKFSRGSQTWANVNTETDKRIGGTTEATKRRASRQASSIMNNIQ